MMSPAQSSPAGVGSVPPVFSKMPARVCPACQTIRAGQDTGTGLFSTPPHLTSPEAPFPHQLGFTSQGGFAGPPPPPQRRPWAGPGADSPTGGSCGVLQGPGQGGPVPALADTGIPGNAGTPHPTRSLKPCCLHLPWTRHTHPHRGLPPRLTPR